MTTPDAAPSAPKVFSVFTVFGENWQVGAAVPGMSKEGPDGATIAHLFEAGEGVYDAYVWPTPGSGFDRAGSALILKIYGVKMATSVATKAVWQEELEYELAGRPDDEEDEDDEEDVPPVTTSAPEVTVNGAS